MKTINYDEEVEVDVSAFAELIGEDILSFIFNNAPRKVLTRVFRSLDHYVRSARLDGVDEEMGAIRLIAAEEELVVAIFEWMKLNEELYPEHGDFVRKFKNHRIKLAFYPILAQFRFVISDMLRSGFGPDGLEDVVNWTAKPIVDGEQIKLALYKEDGEELIRADPFAVFIRRGEVTGEDAVPLLLADLVSTIQEQHGMTLREFLVRRADFRNHLLYATDGGSARLEQTLAELRVLFAETFHDLLWVLALVVGGNPPSKEWGIASQFIGVYRMALADAHFI